MMRQRKSGVGGGGGGGEPAYGGYQGGRAESGYGVGYGGADYSSAAGGYGSSPPPQRQSSSPRKRFSSSSNGGGGGGTSSLILVTFAFLSFSLVGVSLLFVRSKSSHAALQGERDVLQRRLETAERSRSSMEDRMQRSEGRVSDYIKRERVAREKSDECYAEQGRQRKTIQELQQAAARADGGAAKEAEGLRDEVQRLTQELKDSREEAEAAMAREAEAKAKDGDGGGKDGDGGEVAYLTERNHALEERAERLKEHIARESYRSALERFGPGPHNVSIKVELPYDGRFPAVAADPSFTVQLHPLSKMPHAVHLFLEQVAHELWDGCSFLINARHILQAGAHPGSSGGDADSALENKMRKFEDTKLDVLSYQEYHEDYPHKKYTLGFAGRPGGPDFYINKMDNTQNHGPGGQIHEVLAEEADPCFGEVVEGIEVVDRLGQLEDEGTSAHLLKTPLKIIEARIVGVEVPPPRWTVGKDWSVIDTKSVSSSGGKREATDGDGGTDGAGDGTQPAGD